VAAVREHNRVVPPEHAGLSRDRWQTLSVLDPVVRGPTRNAARQLGAAATLWKPFALVELLGIVRSVLGKEAP
jgi:hypothetical protein